PLAPPAALLVGGSADRQSATVEKFGQVSVLEISLARKIDASESSLAAVKQHAEHFDFFLVPLKFGVVGFDGKKCKWMQFGATLKLPGADAAQAFVIDVFPSTSLKRGSVSGDAQIAVGGDLKLHTPTDAAVQGSVGVSGTGNVNMKWSPLYEQVA